MIDQLGWDEIRIVERWTDHSSVELGLLLQVALDGCPVIGWCCTWKGEVSLLIVDGPDDQIGRLITDQPASAPIGPALDISQALELVLIEPAIGGEPNGSPGSVVCTRTGAAFIRATNSDLKDLRTANVCIAGNAIYEANWVYPGELGHIVGLAKRVGVRPRERSITGRKATERWQPARRSRF
jgi:hypothetical protein